MLVSGVCFPKNSSRLHLPHPTPTESPVTHPTVTVKVNPLLLKAKPEMEEEVEGKGGRKKAGGYISY